MQKQINIAVEFTDDSVYESFKADILKIVENYKPTKAKDAVVFTGTDSPDGFKSVGKQVSDYLDHDYITPMRLGAIGGRCGLNVGDVNQMIEIAQTDTKWAGKKVAKYLRQGVMDAVTFSAEMEAVTGGDIPVPEAPSPGTDAPMAPKSVGKSVSASLLDQELDASQLITILEDLVNVSTDELNELEHIARHNEKRAGKKIAKLVKNGQLDGNALLLGIANLDTQSHPADGKHNCHRCGSTDIDAYGQCGNCGFYN